ILRLSDRGFAKSIRTGIENAHGDQIIVMDTDFTHAPSDIPKLLHVSQVFDIVSGSRFCSGGRMQDVQHYLASMAYNWFIRLLLRTQIQDNLGGFFTINRKKLLDLPCDKIFFGYGDYFFRFLFFARKAGLSFVEIPSIYAVRSTGKSKSDFFKMLFSYTIAVLKLKFKNSFLFDSKK
ncbi:MAG: Dolichyl-phosphate beta-D-mannosyltransferase, partial [uncultured bacterium]